MMSDKLSVEAIEMLADDYERGMIGPRRLRQYFDYLIQQLAAAKAELAAAVKKVEDFDLVVVMNKKICSELDAAKARVTELEQQQFAGQTWVTFNEHMKALNKIKQMEDAIKFDFERFMEFQRRAEQAEASCAAMRLRFEKYVRENCKLIRHSVADGLGKPDDVEGKCGGYAQNGDEPHYICQECVAAYDPEDEYNENVIAAGSALLAELQRYREALEKIVGLQYKENYIYFGVHVACKYAEQALVAAIAASSSAPAGEDAQ